MNYEKNICNIVYVPVNYEKKDVGIATRIPESMKREIDRIADEHDRTPAYVIRELMTRGLLLYQQDGQLREVLGVRKTEKVAVLKQKAK